jgi:hypothetical protein
MPFLAIMAPGIMDRFASRRPRLPDRPSELGNGTMAHSRVTRTDNDAAILPSTVKALLSLDLRRFVTMMTNGGTFFAQTEQVRLRIVCF